MYRTLLNWKFILRVVGFILLLESLFMFLAVAVSAYYHGSDFYGMLVAASITFVCGTAGMALTGFKKIHTVGKKEGYLSVTLSWVLFALFGALPFVLSKEIPVFVDAFFESTSGLTTTGSSILTDIDSMSHGLLFWRNLMQWLGGMGIIVFSLALLPVLGGDSSLLFDAESSGLTHDKFRPRVTQMAKRLWAIYLSLTFLVILLLSLGPMSVFDSVCHGFSTIATGGFSTKQVSIAYWNSPYVESVISIFTIFGSLNFALYYFLINGQVKKFFKDEEMRWFLIIILAAGLVVGAGLFFEKQYDFMTAFRVSFFQVITIISTSGFSTADFSAWGSPFLIIFMFLMIVCGCVGSTSGGLKTVRAVVLAKNTICEFRRLIHPRAIIPVRLNGSAIAFSVVQRLLAFAFLYITIIFVSWGVLVLSGISFVDSLGASVSAVGNVGPGFGALGPSGSYAGISVFAKWYLSFLMIVGRLEIFTFLILFTPGFWKR